MKKLYSIILLWFMFLEGCKENIRKLDSTVQEPIDQIEINIEKNEILKFSEVFSDHYFIQLETNDYCLFSSPLQTIITDSNIFIVPKEPRYSILIFNKDGKFLKKIYNIGRGPEEYIAFDYIDVNEKDELITFYDLGNRGIVIMNFEGEILKRLPAKDFFTDFIMYDPKSGHYIAEISDAFIPKTKEIFHVLIYDPHTKDYLTFLPRKIRGNFMSENSLFRYRGDIYYKPPELDTIYKIVGDKLMPRYNLDFLEYKKPAGAFLTSDPLEYKTFKKKGIIWTHYDFKETTDYIFSCHRAIGGKWYLYIFYKKSGSSFIFDRIINDYLGELSEVSLDFIHLPVAVYRDRVVFLHEPTRILKDLNEIQSVLTEEHFKKYLKGNTSYSQLVNTVRYQDNPVLGFYKVRER